MGTRKRMGMFDHAKYSKPVLRSIPDAVQKAVNRDIGRLLDPDAAAVRFHHQHGGQQQKRRHNDVRRIQSALDVSVVNDSFEEEDDHGQHKRICPEKPSPKTKKQSAAKNKPIIAWDKPPIILASHYRPEKDPTKQVGLGRDPTFSAVRDALLKAVGGKEREKSPNLEAEKRIALLLKSRRDNTPKAANVMGEHTLSPIVAAGGINFLATTPSPPQAKLKNNQNESNKKKELFPSECPMEQIAARLMDSFPTITLRNNESQTLTDATFSLAKRALMAAQEREKAAGDDKQREEASISLEMNPFKTLCNQTMNIFPSYLKDTFHTSEFRKDHNNNNTAAVNNDQTQREDISQQSGFGVDKGDADGDAYDNQRGFMLDESPTADLEDFLFQSPAHDEPFTQNLDFSQLQQSQQNGFSTQNILSSAGYGNTSGFNESCSGYCNVSGSGYGRYFDFEDDASTSNLTGRSHK